MSRIVIPSSTDWLQSFDFTSGTVLVEGRLAEMLHPELWVGCVGAWAHALDPRPWDYSGLGNHGSRVGGVTDDPGGGWRFDGSTGYINCGSGVRLFSKLNTQCTIAVQFRFDLGLTGSSTLYTFCGNHVQSTGGVTYSVLENGPAQELWTQIERTIGGASTTGSLAGSVPVGAPLHVVASWNGAQMVQYWNGVLVDSETEGTPSVDATIAFLIGARNNNGTPDQFFPGVVSDLMLWEQSVDASKVGLLASRRNAAYACRLLPKVFAF